MGRVIRFDSLSKVLSAGMRIGFLSAPQAIVDAVLLHVRLSSVLSSIEAPLMPCFDATQTMNSNLQPPTFTQVLSLRLLEFWGYEKLRAHTDRIGEFYRAKRDVFERLMHKHLDGLAEWDTPEAGMFFW